MSLDSPAETGYGSQRVRGVSTKSGYVGRNPVRVAGLIPGHPALHEFEAVVLKFRGRHICALRDGAPPFVVFVDAAAETGNGRLRIRRPGAQPLYVRRTPAGIAALIPGDVALNRIETIFFQVRRACGNHRKHRGKRPGVVEAEAQDAEIVARPGDPDEPALARRLREFVRKAEGLLVSRPEHAVGEEVNQLVVVVGEF